MNGVSTVYKGNTSGNNFSFQKIGTKKIFCVLFTISYCYEIKLMVAMGTKMDVF